jgi:hypothetical protein
MLPHHPWGYAEVLLHPYCCQRPQPQRLLLLLP